MADALWQSASMRALRPQFEDERDENACKLWQLPNWDEYSESGASSRLDISVCSSDLVDFGDDSPSSGAEGGDDVFKRGKLRRSPVSMTGGGGDALSKRTSVLQQLHMRYAKQRQQEELTSRHTKTNTRSEHRDNGDQGKPVVQIEVDMVRGPSDRGNAESRAVLVTPEAVGGGESVAADARAIATQQGVLNSQLQAFRSQLTEMQQRMTPDKASSAANTTPITVAREQHAKLTTPLTISRDRYDMSVQTDSADLRDDAVMQWLNLLTQKIDLLASEYGHDATQSYRTTIEHLAGLKIATVPPASHDENQQKTSTTTDISTSQSSTWHVGGALHTQLPQPTVSRFVELEASLARLSTAFEQSSQRKLELFEKSIRQIEQFHHEKLQQVVNESIEELKMVRGKYKSRQEQLEEQVRLATRSTDDWRQKAAEIEHRSALDRETIEFKAATFREKFEHLSVRFEEDIVRITQQLETARREKSEAQRHQDASGEELEELKQELVGLKGLYDGLNDKRELEIKSFELEQEKWKATLDQLRRDNDAFVQEITTEKQLLAKSLEAANQSHASELVTLRNQFQMEVEDTYRATIVSEKIVELQRRHEKQLETLREYYEQQVEEQGRAVEKALKELREARHAPQVSAAETQTEPSTVTLHLTKGHHHLEAEMRIQELSRKCRALENLLDKKFEQQSAASSQYNGGESTRPLCVSCNNSNDSPRSQASSLRSSGNFLPLGYEPVSSKHAQHTTSTAQLLARKKDYVSSSSHAASSLNDALFTDVDTTMRNETWDSASLTSIDTFEPSMASSYQVLSRPQSASRSINNKGNNNGNFNGVPSNADILALVRKLETYAATSPMLKNNNEPEPEQSIVYRTPESRTNSTKKAQPPPIHRTSHHLKSSASAARKLNRPSTSLTQKPLRGSLLSGSSSSSSSSSSVSENQRLNTSCMKSAGRSMPVSAAGAKVPRSRFI